MLQTIYRTLDEGHRKYPNNELFSIIKKLVATVKKVPKLMELYIAISEYGIDGPEVPVNLTTINNVDRRIMHLMVSSFKVFSKSDNMYGIDFRDAKYNNYPSSTVILGSNGIGKTSIYTAIEMATMQHSYIADVYGYTSISDQQEFVRNVDKPNEQPLVSIVDYSGNEISYPEPNGELCPKAFFCSQFDFEEYQAHGIDQNYVLNQLGYYKLYLLMEIMNDIEMITKKMNRAMMIANELKSKSSQEKEQLRVQIRNLRVDVQKKLGLPKIRLVDYKWANNTITEEVSQVVQFLRSEIIGTIKQFGLIAAELIPQMLNRYLAEDKAHVVVYVTGNSVEPRIVKHGQPQSVEPRLWFNTFRMKMFIIAMKMSLAFTVKIINKFNFPIVMDDLFDSSDFNNKYEIKRFFQSIIIGHNENEVLKQLPLQIICFTQDRLVGDNVYQGLLYDSPNSSVKYCRMFHHMEVDNRDKILAIGTVDYFNITQLIASSI